MENWIKIAPRRTVGFQILFEQKILMLEAFINFNTDRISTCFSILKQCECGSGNYRIIMETSLQRHIISLFIRVCDSMIGKYWVFYLVDIFIAFFCARKYRHNVMNYVGFLLANDWFFVLFIKFRCTEVVPVFALTLSLFFSHRYTFSHYCRCVYLLCSVIILNCVCWCRLVCVRCEYKKIQKKRC